MSIYFYQLEMNLMCSLWMALCGVPLMITRATINTAATCTAMLMSTHLFYNKHPRKTKDRTTIRRLVVVRFVESTCLSLLYITIYGKNLKTVNNAKCCITIIQYTAWAVDAIGLHCKVGMIIARVHWAVWAKKLKKMILVLCVLKLLRHKFLNTKAVHALTLEHLEVLLG